MFTKYWRREFIITGISESLLQILMIKLREPTKILSCSMSNKNYINLDHAVTSYLSGPLSHMSLINNNARWMATCQWNTFTNKTIRNVEGKIERKRMLNSWRLWDYEFLKNMPNFFILSCLLINRYIEVAKTETDT